MIVSKDRLAHECSGNGFCDEMGSCVCNDGWDGEACSHHTTVEETGLPAWGTALIVVGVILIGTCFLCALCRYKNRHIRRQSKMIESIQKELQEVKDSVVGMRSVVSDFTPGEDADVKINITVPKERAIWYWAEDVDRMSSHNANLTLAPHWVQYAGSVAAELEEQYALYKAGAAPAIYRTDLDSRISSTGTEAKAYGQDTGTKYTFDFAQMKQTNAKSGYTRDALRMLVPVGDQSASMKTLSKSSSTSSAGSTASCSSQVPGELAGEVLLALKAGSIVQLSKQRPDGWAFGNVIYRIDAEEEIAADNISRDAGWFPLSCTTMPTKDALKQLSNMMGPAGADCLTPPNTWSELRDPLVAQLFPLPDGPEKQTAVSWFMQTLSPSVQVVKVERIQNLSLWQSFAVKRQTVLSREGKSAMDACASSGTSSLERVWLFHGTTADTVPKIMQQGFNRSFCGRNATMFGKGVYFARDASYSSSKAYAKPDASGIQCMFLCRVVVGEYCQGAKDALAPSVRDAGKHLLYDTTVDNTRDPGIYVTYHDAQAYPEYLVHFKQ